MKSLNKVWIYLFFGLPLFTTACAPTEDPHTASISGGVFYDCDKGGECADDRKGIAGMCVRLYEGSCGGNMIENHNSNKKGEFQFTGLEAGEYCVFADFELLTCGFGGNHPTTAITRHVNLEVGEHADLEWFGFDNLSGNPDSGDSNP